jgi:hypothetical protein
MMLKQFFVIYVTLKSVPRIHCLFRRKNTISFSKKIAGRPVFPAQKQHCAFPPPVNPLLNARPDLLSARRRPIKIPRSR